MLNRGHDTFALQFMIYDTFQLRKKKNDAKLKMKNVYLE